MNEPKLPIDERNLDRLVDGELSPQEYRQLLADLEKSGDGWRRCAHAFLEAQALGTSLPLVMAPAPPSPKAEPAPKVATTDGRKLSFRRIERLSALAACVAVAFGLGWYVSSGGGDSPELPGRPVTSIQNPLEQDPSGMPKHEVQKPKFVYVNQIDGQNTTGIPIPVDPSRTYDPQQPWDDSWGMPPEELKKLQDEGRQFETHNRLIPVTLDNGQRVVVPMQEVLLYDQPERPFH